MTRKSEAGARPLDPESAAALSRLLRSLPSAGQGRPSLDARRALLESLALDERRRVPRAPTVEVVDTSVRSSDHTFDVPLRAFVPRARMGAVAPGILYIHGGGFVMGSVDTDDLLAEQLALAVGAIVVSVGYRLAPEHPYPSGLHDCLAALRWLRSERSDLAVDRGNVAVYGGSAGGSLALASAMALEPHERAGLQLVLAAYPMLDDSNSTASSREVLSVGVWDRDDNVEAWGLYLGGRPADEFAAPARARSLTGLPPVFLDVGDADLFRDETIEFATRLIGDGVQTELHVYPGAFHASEEYAPEADLSRRIVGARISALRRALAPSANWPVQN